MQENFTLFPDERIDRVNENITIIQKKDGLTFGTDAYMLAAFMKEQKKARAVELGAGTGIISLLVASRERFSHVSAVEIQEEFASLASRNVELNGLGERIDIIHSDVRDLTPAHIGGEADVVFSNPPYMKRDSGKRNEADMKYIARHEVCGSVSDFCAAAKKLLKHGGRFYAVWRPDRLSELLTAMSLNSLEPKELTLIAADPLTPPSIALVRAHKGGAAGMNVTRTLFIYHSADDRSAPARKMSADAERIYDTMSFEDFLSR